MSGILALGAYVPERVMTNADFEAYLDTSDEWIVTRTGIKERRIAAEDEYTSDLAFRAVEDLLRRHPGALEGVDGVIVATNTPDALFPDTAALVQARFGLQAFAYDLLAGCPGWIYALAQAHALVEAGLARKVLVVGAEALSKILDWNDRATAVLFGDGGGAAVVGRVREGFGFKSFVLGADGTGGKELYHACVAPRLPDGTSMERRLYMNGREVFKFAVRVMNTATLEAIEKAGLTPEEIRLFVPHQANLRIIDAARERLGLPWERVAVNVDRYGNTSTASIPLALKEAVDEGRIQEGDHVLLVSFGAGLTWAAAVLTWGGGLMYAALFPGQGSHRVGMGKALYEAFPAAREVLDRAEAALPGLLKLMWEGPEEALTLTENQQPALLAAGYAAYRAFLEAGGKPPALAAGHSLGEWTAHVAAGTLELEDALRLVRLRGRYMQEAVPLGEGAMAAVLKLPLEEVQKALEGLKGVEVANLNAPEQTVISGRKQAVEEAAERLKERRARVVFLPVSAPFHSSLMAPARRRLAEDLAQVPLKSPRFPVYSNVTARPEEDPERIRALLLEQITAPVRWVEILRDMEARGVKRFLEFGSGEVLKGLVLRTLKEAQALSVQDPESLRKALEVEDA